MLERTEWDVLRAAREMVDLKGRVPELEALLEQALEPPASVVTVDARTDEHVRRQRGEAARHGPHVEVVHLGDVGIGGESARDVVGIDPCRRGLKEDPARLANQRPARAHHQRRDEQAGDRVEAAPPGEEHECAGERGANERGEIGGHVQVRALYVEARPVGAREHERRREIHCDADERDDEHDAAVHCGRMDEAARRGVHDPDAEQQQRDPVRLGGEDLGAAEPERPLSARRPRCETRGDECRREGRRVREHVTRVGEQRERARDDARGDLDAHEGHDQHEGGRERAPVTRARVAMRVPMRMPVRMHYDSAAQARPSASRSLGVG